MFYFSNNSIEKLSTICEELQAIMHRALSYQIIDFTIAEGIRTPERQALLFAEGKTKTLHSKHITGKAVDVYPYIQGEGMIVNALHPAWWALEAVIKVAGIEENIALEWGGNWKHFIDKPHWQCK